MIYLLFNLKKYRHTTKVNVDALHNIDKKRPSHSQLDSRYDVFRLRSRRSLLSSYFINFFITPPACQATASLESQSQQW